MFKKRKWFRPVTSSVRNLFISSLKADARKEVRLTAEARVEKEMREVKCFERSV